MGVVNKALANRGQVVPGQGVSRFLRWDVHIEVIRQFLLIAHHLLVIAPSSTGIVCLGEIRREGL
jgi:hypothetical protein